MNKKEEKKQRGREARKKVSEHVKDREQNTFFFSASCFFVSCIFVVFLTACSPRTIEHVKQVCFHGQCIQAEVVQTQEERSRGLQFRRSLGKNEGMLFIFESSHRQSFWMKDTFIPLDIIWMDRHKRIVFIIPNVLPCETEKCPVYTPDADAQYVLEVNAGVTAERNLRVGDQAEF